MTEDQIERTAEIWMDRTDEEFLSGRLDQKTYDEAVLAIEVWAQAQHAVARGRIRVHYQAATY